MQVISGETPSNPEALLDEQRYTLLGGVGNHEGKLLVTAIIASCPGISFSENQLFHEVMDRQGELPGWRPRSSVPFQYGVQSLEPIGTVVKSQIAGLRGPIDAFSATEFGEKWGLPLSGVLLDWSLKYPNLSLMQIFGSTSTTATIRSPEVRYKIYNELLTNPEPSLSIVELARQIDIDSPDNKVIKAQTHDLARLGITEVATVQVDYNPTLKIIDPDFYHRAFKFDDLKLETQAIYRAMQSLFHKGHSEIDLDTLVATAIELEPTADAFKVRKKLPQALHGYSKNFPGLELTDRGEVPESARTVVRLKPELVDPLTELCQELDELFNGKDVDLKAERAREIIADPNSVRTLMAKVKKMSPNVRGQTEGRSGLSQRIMSVVRLKGIATLTEIREELEAQGRSMSREGLRLALQPLVEGEQLLMDKKPTSETSKRLVSHYAINQTVSS